MAKDTNMLAVYSGTAGQAHVVRVALEKHGIPHVLRDQSVPLDDAATITAVGAMVTVEVLVAPEDVERAKEAVAGK